MRVGAHHIKSAAAERGVAKSSSDETDLSLGIRVIAGDRMLASGFSGRFLGPGDFSKFDSILKESIEKAYGRALTNSEYKNKIKSSLGVLADSITSTDLGKIEVHEDEVRVSFEQDPQHISLQKIVNESVLISKNIEEQYSKNGYNVVTLSTEIIRELFVSTEGAFIDQTFPLTEGFVYVLVGDEYNYDQLGAQGGWEVLEGKNVFSTDINQFATYLTAETIETSKADILEPSDKEVVVVTDPHFNALVVHEIVGHPVEADRALKMETAYAGRSWLLTNLEENQIGKQIASPLVTAYSDSNVNGYGFYGYDSEGVKGGRVTHIENGIFKGFLNSRESAVILGEEPNGAMQTSGSQYIPVVRMTNTVFDYGSSDPQEIIQEVDDGYYLQGHHTPSIGESRENFSISARRVSKIEKGEIVKTYRSGGITSDSKKYLMSIDAVGNDFVLYPMPNCGKGQPMQVKRVGNGGPTMRGIAKLTGGRK
ncbi:MAG: TldD/PmbA family protein [Candidatus Dadabacteria bacterium]|nr:TldD/PmbA family protein [Candidatus Dadabacteria bacterium]